MGWNNDLVDSLPVGFSYGLMIIGRIMTGITYQILVAVRSQKNVSFDLISILIQYCIA